MVSKDNWDDSEENTGQHGEKSNSQTAQKSAKGNRYGKCSPVHDRIKCFPQMSSSISKKINCRNCGNFNSSSLAERTTPIQ